MSSAELRMPDKLTARMVVGIAKITGKMTKAYALQVEIARMVRVMTTQPDFLAKVNAAGSDGELHVRLDIQPVPGWLLRQRAAGEQAERTRA